MDQTLWRNISLQSWFLARRPCGAGLELQWAGSGKTIRARENPPRASTGLRASS